MEASTEIIITTLKGKSATEIAQCLEVVKIMHKFKYHLEKNGQATRINLYNMIQKDEEMVKQVAKKMGLVQKKRKSSDIARRPRWVWVEK